MRSRTVREGSVGLLILLGAGVLVGLVLWLRGFNPGNRSYRAIIQFPEVAGIQEGAAVSYRGVSVGRVLEVRPGANAVEVEIEILSGSLVIPKDAIVEANQSGLIGSTTIDITPRSPLASTAVAQNPLAADCLSDLVVCNGDRLAGNVGVSFSALVRSSTQFAELFSNPQFFAEVRALTRNSAQAASSVSELSGEVTNLTKSVQQELGSLSAAASRSATSVGEAADQFGLTAQQVNALLSENRSSLVTTLGTIDQTSREVQNLVGTLAPQIEEGSIVQNLETLSANAVAASETLRTLTDSVGGSENMLMLQQTLDSARSTFQNAQKITADLDELTGDPELRQDIRNLINGFSDLVSSSQQLQQQAAIAQVLTPPQTATAEASRSNANDDRPTSSQTEIALRSPEDRRTTITTRPDLRLPTDAEYQDWLRAFAEPEDNSQPLRQPEPEAFSEQ
ncbi:MCE family protein [Phormidium tenue FACHB-886]|nr:MCE family protein [Phormidium tenue FACHB-886]